MAKTADSVKFKFVTGIIINLILVLVLIRIGLTNVFSLSISDDPTFISDCSGGFLRITQGENSMYIDRLKGDSFERVFGEAVMAEQAAVSGYGLILGDEKDSMLAVVPVERGSINHILMINDVKLKENCLTADRYFRVYLVDKNDPYCVTKYIGTDANYKNFKLNEYVISLFCDTMGDRVYAVTKSGIYNIESGELIKCDAPQDGFYLNGKYCTDSRGGVFCFDAVNGFTRICTVPYSNVCVTSEGDIYAASGSVIFRLDENGEVISSYDTGKNIDQLLASKSNTAYVYGTEIRTLDNRLLIPAEKDAESDVSVIDTKEQSSSLSVQHENYYIRSSQYQIYDDMIDGISAGTTAAELKKGIDYGGCTISFVDHNRKSVNGGQLGTGWEVHFSDEGREIIYHTVISGDVTGEGNINSRDTDMISALLLGNAEFDQYQQKAADMDGNGIIDIEDLYSVYRIY